MPDPALVDRMSRLLLANDDRIEHTLRAMIGSPTFGASFGGKSERGREHKKKSPATRRRAHALFTGADERNRTVDLRITNALLYQLSYTGKNRILADRLRPPQRAVVAPSAARQRVHCSSKRSSFFFTASFFKVT